MSTKPARHFSVWPTTFAFFSVATSALRLSRLAIINAHSANTITSTVLTAATGSVVYTSVQFTTAGVFGGSASFCLLFGNLPIGMALSAGGVLSKTPKTDTFNFSVKATDSLGCVGTVALTLAVNCAAVMVNPATLPDAQSGGANNQRLTQTSLSGAYESAGKADIAIYQVHPFNTLLTALPTQPSHDNCPDAETSTRQVHFGSGWIGITEGGHGHSTSRVQSIRFSRCQNTKTQRHSQTINGHGDQSSSPLEQLPKS